MTYSWDQVVERLYNHLGVRPTTLRITPANCQFLADALQALRQRPSLRIEPDVITAIGLLAANVVALPPTRVMAIPLLKGPIRLLIFQAALQIDAPPEVINAVHRITGIFFFELATRLGNCNTPLSFLRSHPLAGFHAWAWQDARTQGWMLQYLAYALCVHRHLINKWKQMQNSAKPFGLRKILNNLYGHCVGARYLLPRLPRPAAPAPKEPGSADLVSAIITIGAEPNSRRKRLLIRRARQFVQLLDATREIRPANRSICTTQSHSRPIPSELRRSHAHLDNPQPPSGISASEMVLACDSDDAATDEDGPVITRTRRVWVAQQTWTMRYARVSQSGTMPQNFSRSDISKKTRSKPSGNANGNAREPLWTGRNRPLRPEHSSLTTLLKCTDRSSRRSRRVQIKIDSFRPS